jgi:ring-1,2-phenylacetyl-CoA epoxidase subunit PaaD
MLTVEQAWRVLGEVADPEIPVISVCELGIVRDVTADDTGVTVVVTPTYSGCPATEVIARDIEAALVRAGASRVRVATRLSPPWTTDWIAPEAAGRLRAYGIVPPGPRPSDGVQPVRLVARSVPCPRCGARNTARLSEFGSTPCKATYRCADCGEPFEYFKPL